MASLQIESGGRAVLVLGRGDSAVLQLGLRPATTAQLERAVGEVRGFLRGDAVPTVDGATARLTRIESLGLAEVPVSVAATGPATIALGARCAGRIDLTVGADPQRVAWAVAEARADRSRSRPDRQVRVRHGRSARRSTAGIALSGMARPKAELRPSV